jgi:hypothetical protein
MTITLLEQEFSSPKTFADLAAMVARCNPDAAHARAHEKSATS